MAQPQSPYILREGWPFVAVAIACAAIVQYLADWTWATPFWGAMAVALYLFRDPERQVPAAPLGVVSPADGTVMAVEQTQDDFLGRPALKISIRMRRRGGYVTRSPIEGKIVKQWRRPGDQAATTAYGIWVQTDERDDVVLVVRIGRRLFGPSCHVGIGERIGQGQRCGLVPLGGDLDVLMPANTRAEVAVGDRVSAGADLIATLVH